MLNGEQLEFRFLDRKGNLPCAGKKENKTKNSLVKKLVKEVKESEKNMNNLKFTRHI